ncbi:hypothetical protein IV102_14875 [bacterium]|nr:hypothetical protein [bacterium]
MAEALHPGSVQEGCTIEEVLAWDARGGLYRVTTPTGNRLLKEILFPPDLPTLQRGQRAHVLREAVSSWQGLQQPLAISVERFAAREDRCYIVLPELNGSRLSVQSRLRASPPEPHQATRWADQIAALAEALLDIDHPLTFELLDADRILANSQGQLTVFNPGWTEMIWQDPQQFGHRTVREILRRYAELLVTITTGDSHHPPNQGDLPHGLIWLVSRCLSQNSSSNYKNFGEVRQALRNLNMQGDEPKKLRSLSSMPALLEFILPSLAPLRRNPRGPIAALFFVVGLASLVWFWLYLINPRPELRPALALAIGRKIYLWSPTERQLRSHWNFSKSIQAMTVSQDGSRLYVALQRDQALWVIQSDSGERRSWALPGTATSLEWSYGQSQLLVLLREGRLLELEVDRELFGDCVNVPVASQALLTVPLHSKVAPKTRKSRGQGLITLERDMGLSLYDMDEKRRIVQRQLSGATSAILYQGSSIVCATAQPSLHSFTFQLSPLTRRQIPAKPGPVKIYSFREGSRFWTVHAHQNGQGTVGAWSGIEPNCTGQIALASKPLRAAVDDSGKLWLVTEPSNLCLIEPSPLRLTRLASLPGTVSTMAYLSPRVQQSGLDKVFLNRP